jgi:hypothetical protein
VAPLARADVAPAAGPIVSGGEVAYGQMSEM